MAELGWLGAGLSEDEGGFGGGPVETMVVMEAAGRGLMQEPLVPVMVHAVRLLLATGQDAETIAPVVSGEEILTVALDARSAATVTQRGDAYELNGAKRLVPFGDTADGFLVAATLDGAPVILRVAANAAGVSTVAYRTLDDRRAADVSFDGTPLTQADILARGSAAAAALASAEAYAAAALCAEATGIAAFLHETTLDYVKTRQQFGKAIGSFQAIQHRLADMFVAVEEARSLAIMATVRLNGSDEASRTHAIAAAKLGVMTRAMHVAREAIQLHGGVGMTEDLPIGAGFRRLKAMSLTYGDESTQLDRMVSGISAGIYA